jgi:hypothetical protein
VGPLLDRGLNENPRRRLDATWPAPAVRRRSARKCSALITPDDLFWKAVFDSAAAVLLPLREPHGSRSIDTRPRRGCISRCHCALSLRAKREALSRPRLLPACPRKTCLTSLTAAHVLVPRREGSNTRTPHAAKFSSTTPVIQCDYPQVLDLRNTGRVLNSAGCPSIHRPTLKSFSRATPVLPLFVCSISERCDLIVPQHVSYRRPLGFIVRLIDKLGRIRLVLHPLPRPLSCAQVVQAP